MVAQRNITRGELDSTWICFDSHNQSCMRLSDFASQSATAQLCPNPANSKNGGGGEAR